MSTQWREQSGGNNVVRAAFRVERGAGNSTRLFTRQQLAKSANESVSADSIWPASSHDPENTSELMVRLMVFLGVQEQQAKGILNNDAAVSLLLDATLESTASDTFLVVHKGYQPAFRAVDGAVKAISSDITATDKAMGRVDAVVNGVAVSFRISAVNVSAARVTVNAEQPLTREQQQALLGSLRDQLV